LACKALEQFHLLGLIAAGDEDQVLGRQGGGRLGAGGGGSVHGGLGGLVPGGLQVGADGRGQFQQALVQLVLDEEKEPRITPMTRKKDPEEED